MTDSLGELLQVNPISLGLAVTGGRAQPGRQRPRVFPAAGPVSPRVCAVGEQRGGKEPVSQGGEPQPWVILSPRGHWAMSGHICGCHELGSSWHCVSGGQGCCSVPRSAQDSPPEHVLAPVSAVLRGDSALGQHRGQGVNVCPVFTSEPWVLVIPKLRVLGLPLVGL